MRYFSLFILLVLSALRTSAQPVPLLPWCDIPSPKYEVRAMWLTVIMGLDWPKTTDQEAQRRHLIQILDQLRDAGINTVLIQARVRATTIYPSKLEPWEGGFSGRPGVAPAYDPLKFCIDECHKRGMECHAWVVTLPVGDWNKIGAQQLRKKRPKLLKRIGSDTFMNPEKPETATYLADICREIVHNYDVDGIHLDYIRYPEQEKIKVSRAKGRENITNIVRAIHNAVKQEKPWVKLSCSPIGKHDDLTRYRAGGWNARTAVCQDAQEWLRLGLMDQLYPMMYFQGNNFYPFAIDWKEKSYGRTVSSGLGIYFLDPREGTWTLDMVERQMYVARQLGLGHCYFRSQFFTDNVKGVYDFAKRFDATPALVPPMTWEGKPAPSAPTTISLQGNNLSWSGAEDNSGAPYLLYNVYASADYPVDITKAENLMATRLTTTSMLVPQASVNYAVTSMNRYGQESPAIQLLLNAGPEYSAQLIAKSDGKAIVLPKKESTLDADFVIVEDMKGAAIGIYPYAETLDIRHLPDGMYQLRSLGRKGRTHRIGFFAKKSPGLLIK
ncbi:MAG: family 10 glycosylhydrolase [Prevotella sp.]|nr:family 10 glycosylhydrolase [Prevotella sp.]